MLRNIIRGNCRSEHSQHLRSLIASKLSSVLIRNNPFDVQGNTLHYDHQIAVSMLARLACRGSRRLSPQSIQIWAQITDNTDLRMFHVYVGVNDSSLCYNAWFGIRNTYLWDICIRVVSYVWVGRFKWVSFIEWSKVVKEWYWMTQHEMLVGGYFRMLRDEGSWTEHWQPGWKAIF
jgi:hypothetical protein